MPQAPTQRAFAERAVEQLRNAGYEALWAGGCVRDELLGRPPKDFDIATSALPDQVREVFGKKRTLAIGAAFGVITVMGPRGAGPIEVATFRADGGYSDGRRPDGVVYTNAEEDARRRDFTINGLFFDPRAGRVVDHVGGRADLEAGIVRAIGNPDERFDEDKLRMLRAVRFAATLGFQLDQATAEAVRRHAGELAVVSAERVGGELRRMLVDPSRGRAVELLEQVGLLRVVLPELRVAPPAIAERLARLAEPSVGLALACLLRGSVDATGAGEAARRLRFTKREGEQSAWLLENVDRLESAPSRPWSRLQPLLAHRFGPDLVSLYEALRGGADDASRHCRGKLSLPAEELDPPPLVVGRDLIAHGLKPCPEFADWLAAARAAQLDGEARTRAEALALIDRLSG